MGNLLIAVPFIAIGVLLIAGFIVLLVMTDRHRKWLYQHGEVVFATVTGIKRKRGDEGGTYYVVTAQWTDPRTDSTYTFRERKNRRPQYAEGSQIQIVVNQNKPNDYAIKDQVQ